MSKELEQKIYSMSNSFLPLDMFYNDIRDNKAENYNKEQAYKDLEIIADFILDLQSQLDQANERLKGAINKPKFEHFEICFYIENNPYCNNELQIFRGEILEINVAFDEDYLYEYRFDTSCRYIEENMIFTTLEEAEKKLREL